jgi:hypothetical protein
MNNKGSMIIMMIPLVLSLFLVATFILEQGRAWYILERAQIVADMTVLSTLRMRAESLQTIAERWAEYGNKLTQGNLMEATIQSSSWHDVETKAAKLKSALSGYKGRSTAVIGVVAEANGILKSAVDVSDNAGASLGLSAQSQWVTDEQGLRKFVPGLWLMRDWSPTTRLANPEEKNIHHVTLTAPPWGKIPVTSQGKVVWDVPLMAFSSMATAAIPERGMTH